MDFFKTFIAVGFYPIGRNNCFENVSFKDMYCFLGLGCFDEFPNLPIWVIS